MVDSLDIDRLIFRFSGFKIGGGGGGGACISLSTVFGLATAKAKKADPFIRSRLIQSNILSHACSLCQDLVVPRQQLFALADEFPFQSRYREHLQELSSGFHDLHVSFSFLFRLNRFERFHLRSLPVAASSLTGALVSAVQLLLLLFFFCLTNALPTLHHSHDRAFPYFIIQSLKILDSDIEFVPSVFHLLTFS
jgi:hypothetical protein